MSNSRYEVSVLIGRFQIFHNGQLALLRHALACAEQCVVVLGSSLQARSPKNPFTWQERAQMILAALPEADRARLRFVPMRDYYEPTRWAHAVNAAVSELVGKRSPGAVALVGHFKDASSDYLRDFPSWVLESLPSQGKIDSTQLRRLYFSAAPGEMSAALAAMASLAPASSLEFLQAWANQAFYAQLVHEWASIEREKTKWASAPYPPVFVTVDAIVVCSGQVLLIRRGRAPGKGLLAVPGGFLEQRETVYQSALRELREETSVELSAGEMQQALQAVQVFDHPDRSLRGRVITHAHYFDFGDRPPLALAAADDAASAEWRAIDQLAGLEDQFHEDHFHILDFFFGLTPLKSQSTD